MNQIVIAIICTVFCISLSAQEKTLITVHMKNGDVISGYADISVIPFSTDYGSLAFPVSEVNKIVLGINSDGIDRDELYGQLDKIRFGSLEESERAFDRLIEKDERILPMMRDYMEAPDYQPKLYNPFTIELLFHILLEKYSLPTDFTEYDVVYYDEIYSAQGLYKFETITLDSDYGQFIIARNSIYEIEIQLQEADIFTTKSFKLFSDQYISANRKEGWLKTGILVKAGDNLRIGSEGEIVLESLDGNTYTADGGVNGSPPPNEKGPLFGQVVYKIGEKGATIIAGDSYRSKVETTGILYLSIFESVYNSGNKGHYLTKVKVNQLD